MYISSIQIKNYKGYRDSARLDLNTGINIIVGKNNAGKMALLEALSMKFLANPHRSLLTKPIPSRSLKPTFIVDFTLTLTRDEVIEKYLGVIGSRLADVFGYDRVLWVEGDTEEICFPIILRELTDQPLLGTAILRVQQTGDFNRRDAKNVIAIYERLSQLEGGLVPPVIGFIFDKEDRSQKEMDDLKRQSHNRVHFTPKRLYESYLLNPSAIAAVANSIKGFSRRKINEQRVRQWIDEHKREAKYYRPLKFPTANEETWTDSVHGALLLSDLFSELSKGLVQFDKKEHSPMLTEWVVKNAPEDLREISQLLVKALIS
jgi:hypothetical protein